MPAVFVYGTLRQGSWNHERWMAPWLGPGGCRAATLTGYALHHVDSLPYVIADADRSVVGDVADVLGGGLAVLDDLEDVAGGHYERVLVTLDDDTGAWVYVAGARVAAAMGADTIVEHGDWLRCRV